jgi:hypothetical protein
MRTNVSVAVAVLAGLLPVGRPALADTVPVDTLVICGVTTVSTAPSQTVYGCAFNNSGATYDLKSGQFSVGAGPTGDAELITSDVFLVSGPSSTTLIPFSAQFAVHVGRTYDGRAIAGIRSDGQAQEFTSNGSWVGSDFYQILTLPLSHTTGERFHLAFHLRAINPDVGAIGPATASARLVFAVPPGYMVTSSQGYSSLPTPTRQTTWGHLKVIYR